MPFRMKQSNDLDKCSTLHLFDRSVLLRKHDDNTAETRASLSLSLFSN
jgi:hypothetical protein